MPDQREEEDSIRQFEKYLLQRYPGAKVRFRRERADPPDFWLWRDGVRYAVEVTRAVNNESATIMPSLASVVAEAAQLARASGVLSGKYLVSFQARLVKGAHKRELRQFVLDYVANTAVTPTAPPAQISIGGRPICHVSKYSSQGASIASGGGITDAGAMVADIQRELRDLLQTVIASKAAKLAKVSGPKVLLLVDCFMLDDRAAFCESVASVREAAAFDCIYVVERWGPGYAASVGPSWV